MTLGVRLFGISLLCAGSILLIVGAAILTARGAPPEWRSWWWQLGERQIGLAPDFCCITISTPSAGGFWDTTLVGWPPRMQMRFTSAEMLAHLRDKGWTSEEDTNEFKRLSAIDARHSWTWPDYYGQNERYRREAATVSGQ